MHLRGNAKCIQSPFFNYGDVNHMCTVGHLFWKKEKEKKVFCDRLPFGPSPFWSLEINTSFGHLKCSTYSKMSKSFVENKNKQTEDTWENLWLRKWIDMTWKRIMKHCPKCHISCHTCRYWCRSFHHTIIM